MPAPSDATYVTINDETASLPNSVRHVNISEDQKHTPKAHTLASHSSKDHSELTGVGADDHHSSTSNGLNITPASATVSGDVNVAGKVGIKLTEAPNSALQVNGSIAVGNFGDTSRAGGTFNIFDLVWLGQRKGIYSLDGLRSDGDIVLETGKVGIGTTGPGSTMGSYGTHTKLDLVSASTQGWLRLASGATGEDVTSIWLHPFDFANGGWMMGTNNDGKLRFGYGSGASEEGAVTNAKDGTSGITIQTDGNVGIGTVSPGAKLEVSGQIKITGGSPGAGKVLTSDATGLATWETASGGAHTLDSHLKEGTPDAFKLTDCLQLWQGTTKKIELDPGTNYATRMMFADNIDTFLGGGAGVLVEAGSERLNVRANDGRPWNENLTSAAVDGLVVVQNWKPVWRGATDSANHFAGAFVADKIETASSGLNHPGKYHAFYAPNMTISTAKEVNGESGLFIGDITTVPSSAGLQDCSDAWGIHCLVMSGNGNARLQGASFELKNAWSTNFNLTDNNKAGKEKIGLIIGTWADKGLKSWSQPCYQGIRIAGYYRYPLSFYEMNIRPYQPEPGDPVPPYHYEHTDSRKTIVMGRDNVIHLANPDDAVTGLVCYDAGGGQLKVQMIVKGQLKQEWVST